MKRTAEEYAVLLRLLDEALDLPQEARNAWIGQLSGPHAELRPTLQRLLQAKDPQEMGAVYQGHLKEQMEKMNAQFRELGSLMSKPAPVDLNK